MDSQNFDKVVSERCEKIKKVLGSKGKEYSTKTDRLHNFKVAARMNGITPEQALWHMLTKHTVSIMDMVNGNQKPTKEMIDEKIGDAINYHILLEGLMLEGLGNETGQGASQAV